MRKLTRHGLATREFVVDAGYHHNVSALVFAVPTPTLLSMVERPVVAPARELMRVQYRHKTGTRAGLKSEAVDHARIKLNTCATYE
jgi:hypothetical protein